MSDSFDKEFAVLRELGKDTFLLRGSTIIVEVLPDEEIKTKGGLIMASAPNQVKGNSIEQHKLQVGRVLMVGEGYWDDDKGTYEALPVQVGARVILPQYSTQFISMFPGIQRPTANRLGMVKMDQILAYYPSDAAYEQAKAKLNA